MNNLKESCSLPSKLRRRRSVCRDIFLKEIFFTASNLDENEAQLKASSRVCLRRQLICRLCFLKSRFLKYLIIFLRLPSFYVPCTYSTWPLVDRIQSLCASNLWCTVWSRTKTFLSVNLHVGVEVKCIPLIFKSQDAVWLKRTKENLFITYILHFIMSSN